MSKLAEKSDVKVADEVWLAAALLHTENPEAADFSIDEIVERAKRESKNIPFRRGVYVHVVQHCVANRPPNPARYRMLLETAPGRRRLFQKGDPYSPGREGGKIVPLGEGLPERYKGLLNWYQKWSTGLAGDPIAADPLLALRGSGKRLWADEHADDYVRRLREGWQ
jgi:hypothetical protein